MPYLEHSLIKTNTIEARLYQQVISNTATKANTLVVLPTGLGKCHVFEDLVLLSNGEVMAIGELVGGAMNKSKLLFDGGGGKLSLGNASSPQVLSLDERGALRDAQIDGFYVSTVDRTLKIESESGVEVEVTPEHPLLGMEDGRPFWRMAKDFTKGDYIGVLRKLNFTGKKQDIDFIAPFQNLPSNVAAYALIDGTKVLLNDLEDDKKTRIDGILIKRGRSVRVPMKPIWKLTPSLARFLGLVISVGCRGRGILFYNEEEALLNDFKSLSKDLFGLKCKRIEGGLKLSCTALAYFLRNIFGMKLKSHSREKKIPSLIMKSTNDEVGAFIGGLFDGDGSVRKDGVLELMTASEDISNKLPYLLLRLGIKARVHRKRSRATNSPMGEYRTYYRICIEGLEDIRKFYAQIRLKHPKKEKSLREIIASGKSENTNVDVFPVGEIIKLFHALGEIEGVRAAKFIGQADRGEGEGLTQREQAKILGKFRAGEVNTLVATSVAEEGLDIPNVDLVLFYEAVPSEIRLIQRRGRTGRTGPGRVVALLAKDTRDEAFYWSAVHKEQRMREVLRGLGEVEPMAEEQRRMEEFSPRKVRIIVDHRETPSGVVRELIELGVEVDTKQLDVGDFILSDRVGVERKSVGDFLQSIVDKRLLSQAKQLSETFERPVLVLEGEGLYSRRAIHPNAIRGALAALAVDFGISVLPTQDEKETASILAMIARREQAELAREVAIRGEAKGLTLPQQQRFIIEGLPGVSAVLAERLLSHFKTPERVMSASEEELREVAGIGEVKAREIRRVLSTFYQP